MTTWKRTALGIALVSLSSSPSSNYLNAQIYKANNSNALNLGTSWLLGVAPGPASTAAWDSTVLGSNSSALGASVSWQGIQVTNPGGAITIAHATGNVLTLGSGGIDMSMATQNLTLLNNANVAGNVAISANQTWNVAPGRTLQFFSNSNTQNQRLTGAGNIEVTGGGIVRMLVGDAGSTTFTSGNGNDTYTGNWTITNGSVRNLRNGTHAWGQGTVFLNGGTVGQEQGNWTWTNPFVLNSATTSTFDDFNTSGTTRALKLQGVLSGNGNVNFNDSANRMNNDNGYILTADNTLSGTVTIGASGDVRIGGVPGDDTTLGVGGSGTLGTATVVNNGTLTLSRNNTWTFGNNISGSGLLRIGLNTGSPTHIVTVSGNNSHAGGTTLQSAVTLNIGSSTALGTGPLTIAGNGNFDNLTGSPITHGNSLVMSGGSPTFTGTNPITFSGGQIIGANRTITVNGSTLTISGALTQDASTRNFTKSGVGTLVLGSTNTYTGTTTINAGTLDVTGSITNNGPASVFIAAPDNSVGDNPQLIRKVVSGNSYTLGSLTGQGSTGNSVDVATTGGTASIMVSANASADANVSMRWRTRTTSEVNGSIGHNVLSDVISLTGVATDPMGGLDVFLLEMSYNPTVLTALGLNEAAIAASGELQLGWKNGSVWVNSVSSNTPVVGYGGSAVANYQGSWSTLGITTANIKNHLGSYGVDTTNNKVWAVLNHNSEFAVIPEPSAMLAGSAIALGMAAVGFRRRRVKG